MRWREVSLRQGGRGKKEVERERSEINVAIISTDMVWSLDLSNRQTSPIKKKEKKKEEISQFVVVVRRKQVLPKNQLLKRG
jgi:hypothetical protein